MLNLATGILFAFLLLPSNISNTCNDYVENHPVRSDIMMQVVLKSYGYYEGKIDGIFGNCLLYTSPSPRDRQKSRMPSSA